MYSTCAWVCFLVVPVINVLFLSWNVCLFFFSFFYWELPLCWLVSSHPVLSTASIIFQSECCLKDGWGGGLQAIVEKHVTSVFWPSNTSRCKFGGHWGLWIPCCVTTCPPKSYWSHSAQAQSSSRPAGWDCSNRHRLSLGLASEGQITAARVAVRVTHISLRHRLRSADGPELQLDVEVPLSCTSLIQPASRQSCPVPVLLRLCSSPAHTFVCSVVTRILINTGVHSSRSTTFL